MLATQVRHEPLPMARRNSRLGRSARIGAAFVAVFCAATLISGGSHAAMAPDTIEISNFSFGPAVLTVPAGTTVTWVNEDEEPHTVVESNTLFKSHALDTGDKFSFTFTTPGTYEYFCTIHAHMVGKVVVQ